MTAMDALKPAWEGGHLNDSSWWWQYGLDGIAGGLLGGAVTALAVVMTLRHERYMSDLESVRSLASRLHAMSWSAQDVLTSGAEDEKVRTAREMIQLTFELAALARSRWPGFSSCAEGMRDSMIERMDNPTADPSAADIAGRNMLTISMWLEDPRTWDETRRHRVRRAWWRLKWRVREHVVGRKSTVRSAPGLPMPLGTVSPSNKDMANAISELSTLTQDLVESHGRLVGLVENLHDRVSELEGDDE